MIYVDSNVPVYLVGAEHPNKKRVIELSAQLIGAREALVTSAESFQELIHRYLSLHDRLHLNAAYEALEALISQTTEITKNDVDDARSLTGIHERLSSRDCLHVAVMRRLGCSRIWSYDNAFDQVPSIQRIA